MLTRTQIISLIKDQCPTTPNMVVSFEDKVYPPVSLTTIQAAMEARELHQIPYHTEIYDCDDYALCFAAVMCRWCVGRIKVIDTDYGAKHPKRHHMLNVFVDPRNLVWYIDAMAGLIFEPEKAENYIIYWLDI